MEVVLGCGVSVRWDKKKTSKDKRVHVIMSYGMMTIPRLFFFFLSCFWKQRRTNLRTGEMIKSHDGEVSG